MAVSIVSALFVLIFKYSVTPVCCSAPVVFPAFCDASAVSPVCSGVSAGFPAFCGVTEGFPVFCDASAFSPVFCDAFCFGNALVSAHASLTPEIGLSSLLGLGSVCADDGGAGTTSGCTDCVGGKVPGTAGTVMVCVDEGGAGVTDRFLSSSIQIPSKLLLYFFGLYILIFSLWAVYSRLINRRSPAWTRTPDFLWMMAAIADRMLS